MATATARPFAMAPNRTSVLVRSALAGGLILFAWTAFSWMALPWHEAVLTAFSDEAQITAAIGATAPHSGIYVLPFGEDAAAQEKMMRGPMVFASVRQGAMESMGGMMAQSVAVQIVAALIGTWLLLHAPGLAYWRKVGFLAVTGLLIGIAGHMPSWIWWDFSLAYVLLEIADLIIGWTLAGLAIARFVP